MKRFLSTFLILFILITGLADAQEVIIENFPAGVGNSIKADFFKPYYNQLDKIADALKNNPKAIGVITGSADGEQYKDYHDTKNSAIALSRAHALRGYLLSEFMVNSSQLIVDSKESKNKDSKQRSASVRIISDATGESNQVKGALNDLGARLDKLEAQPPVEKHFTEIKEVPPPITEYLGLRFEAGLTTSPFGGIPVVAGAVRWNHTVFIGVLLGHTVWHNSYTYDSEKLDTHKRLFGGRLTYYPWENKKIGFVGGWVRIEEVSKKYYEYVRLSEGPMVGIEIEPLSYLTFSGLYNPSRHRIVGKDESIAKNSQFIFSVSLFKLIGGAK